MGLGYAVLGYMTLLALMYPYSVMSDVLAYVSVVPVAGCALIIAGLLKLSSSYRYAKLGAYAAVPLCLYSVFAAVRAFIGMTLPDADAVNPLALPVIYEVLLQAALFMAFHIMLYNILKKMALELGDKKRAWRATRNSWFMYAYFAFIVLAVLPVAQIQQFTSVFTPLVMLFGLGWFAANIVLVFGSYMKLSMTAIEQHKDL